jgi:hypothetical protein
VSLPAYGLLEALASYTVTAAGHSANTFTMMCACRACANSSAVRSARPAQRQKWHVPAAGIPRPDRAGRGGEGRFRDRVISPSPDGGITMIGSCGARKAQRGVRKRQRQWFLSHGSPDRKSRSSHASPQAGVPVWALSGG